MAVKNWRIHASVATLIITGHLKLRTLFELIIIEETYMKMISNNKCCIKTPTNAIFGHGGLISTFYSKFKRTVHVIAH